MYERLRSFILQVLPQLTMNWVLVETLSRIKNLRKGEFLFWLS
jgi:hypothetical protein